MTVVFAIHGPGAHIYTTDSISASSTTASFVVPAQGPMHSYKLCHSTSSTDEDLVAIQKAVEVLDHLFRLPSSLKGTLVCIDKGCLLSARVRNLGARPKSPKLWPLIIFSMAS